MSDGDATVYTDAVDRLIAALDRLSQSIEQGAGMGLIASGHPSVLELTHQLQHLTTMSRVIADKLDEHTDAAFQEMVDRPSVEHEARNTRDDYPDGSDDEDAARV